MRALILVPVLVLVFGLRSRAGARLGAAAGATPMERAANALDTMDLAVIRATAKQLRQEGEIAMADALDRALPLIEKLKAGAAKKKTWPAGADPVLDRELQILPTVLSQSDLATAAWMRAEDNGGPPLTAADLHPERERARPLTPREKWCLAPYFGVPADLEATLTFGMPPGMEGQTPPELCAMTFTDPQGRTQVYFPHGPQSLLGRWWMATLAHELTHGAQARLGLGRVDTAESMALQMAYGYVLSPVEVQARYYQRVVYADLVRRAAAYWMSRGPMPVFQ